MMRGQVAQSSALGRLEEPALKRRGAGGFTLIEAVVALVIIGIIAAVAGTAISRFVEARIEGERAYQHTQQRISAMNWILYQAREAGGASCQDDNEPVILEINAYDIYLDSSGSTPRVFAEENDSDPVYLGELSGAAPAPICAKRSESGINLIRITLGDQSTYVRER